MSLLEFLLIALATWRITSLIVAEDGPFRIFARIRAPFVWEGGNRSAMNQRIGWVPDLFRCIWCMSIYVAPIAWALWFFVPYAEYVVIAFAISGAAIIIEAFSGGSKDHM